MSLSVAVSMTSASSFKSPSHQSSMEGYDGRALSSPSTTVVSIFCSRMCLSMREEMSSMLLLLRMISVWALWRRQQELPMHMAVSCLSPVNIHILITSSS